jgi:hypothetical protein
MWDQNVGGLGHVERFLRSPVHCCTVYFPSSSSLQWILSFVPFKKKREIK